MLDLTNPSYYKYKDNSKNVKYFNEILDKF